MNILEHLKGHRVGIIQNEFVKLSIDGDILRDDDIKMIEKPLGKTKLCIRNKKISDQIKQQALLFRLFKITSKQDSKARNSEEGNVNT